MSEIARYSPSDFSMENSAAHAEAYRRPEFDFTLANIDRLTDDEGRLNGWERASEEAKKSFRNRLIYSIARESKIKKQVATSSKQVKSTTGEILMSSLTADKVADEVLTQPHVSKSEVDGYRERLRLDKTHADQFEIPEEKLPAYTSLLTSFQFISDRYCYGEIDESECDKRLQLWIESITETFPELFDANDAKFLLYQVKDQLEVLKKTYFEEISLWGKDKAMPGLVELNLAGKIKQTNKSAQALAKEIATNPWVLSGTSMALNYIAGIVVAPLFAQGRKGHAVKEDIARLQTERVFGWDSGVTEDKYRQELNETFEQGASAEKLIDRLTSDIAAVEALGEDGIARGHNSAINRLINVVALLRVIDQVGEESGILQFTKGQRQSQGLTLLKLQSRAEMLLVDLEEVIDAMQEFVHENVTNNLERQLDRQQALVRQKASRSAKISLAIMATTAGTSLLIPNEWVSDASEWVADKVTPALSELSNTLRQQIIMDAQAFGMPVEPGSEIASIGNEQTSYDGLPDLLASLDTEVSGAVAEDITGVLNEALENREPGVDELLSPNTHEGGVVSQLDALVEQIEQRDTSEYVYNDYGSVEADFNELDLHIKVDADAGTVTFDVTGMEVDANGDGIPEYDPEADKYILIYLDQASFNNGESIALKMPDSGVLTVGPDSHPEIAALYEETDGEFLSHVRFTSFATGDPNGVLIVHNTAEGSNITHGLLQTLSTRVAEVDVDIEGEAVDPANSGESVDGETPEVIEPADPIERPESGQTADGDNSSRGSGRADRPHFDHSAEIDADGGPEVITESGDDETFFERATRMAREGGESIQDIFTGDFEFPTMVAGEESRGMLSNSVKRSEDEESAAGSLPTGPYIDSAPQAKEGLFWNVNEATPPKSSNETKSGVESESLSKAESKVAWQSAMTRAAWENLPQIVKDTNIDLRSFARHGGDLQRYIDLINERMNRPQNDFALFGGLSGDSPEQAARRQERLARELRDVQQRIQNHYSDAFASLSEGEIAANPSFKYLKRECGGDFNLYLQKRHQQYTGLAVEQYLREQQGIEDIDEAALDQIKQAYEQVAEGVQARLTNDYKHLLEDIVELVPDTSKWRSGMGVRSRYEYAGEIDLRATFGREDEEEILEGQYSDLTDEEKAEEQGEQNAAAAQASQAEGEHKAPTEQASQEESGVAGVFELLKPNDNPEIANRTKTASAQEFLDKFGDRSLFKSEVGDYTYMFTPVGRDQVMALVYDKDEGDVKVRHWRISGSDHQWKAFPGLREDGSYLKGDEDNPNHHYVQSAKLHPDIYKLLNQLPVRQRLKVNFRDYLPVKNGDRQDELEFSEQYYQFKNPEWRTYQAQVGVMHKWYQTFIAHPRSLATDSQVRKWAIQLNEAGKQENMPHFYTAFEPFLAEMSLLENEINNLRTGDNSQVELANKLETDMGYAFSEYAYVRNNIDERVKRVVERYRECATAFMEQAAKLLKSPDDMIPDFTEEAQVDRYFKPDPPGQNDTGVWIEEFEVTNDQGEVLRWAMAEDTKGRVYIDNIYNPQVGINDYGVPAEITNMGLLVYKPEDYAQQTLGLTSKYTSASTLNYVDIHKFWSENFEPIKLYKQELERRKNATQESEATEEATKASGGNRADVAEEGAQTAPTGQGAESTATERQNKPKSSETGPSRPDQKGPNWWYEKYSGTGLPKPDDGEIRKSLISRISNPKSEFWVKYDVKKRRKFEQKVGKLVDLYIQSWDMGLSSPETRYDWLVKLRNGEFFNEEDYNDSPTGSDSAEGSEQNEAEEQKLSPRELARKRLREAKDGAPQQDKKAIQRIKGVKAEDMDDKYTGYRNVEFGDNAEVKEHYNNEKPAKLTKVERQKAQDNYADYNERDDEEPENVEPVRPKASEEENEPTQPQTNDNLDSREESNDDADKKTSGSTGDSEEKSSPQKNEASEGRQQPESRTAGSTDVAEITPVNEVTRLPGRFYNSINAIVRNPETKEYKDTLGAEEIRGLKSLVVESLDRLMKNYPLNERRLIYPEMEKATNRLLSKWYPTEDGARELLRGFEAIASGKLINLLISKAQEKAGQPAERTSGSENVDSSNEDVDEAINPESKEAEHQGEDSDEGGNADIDEDNSSDEGDFEAEAERLISGLINDYIGIEKLNKAPSKNLRSTIEQAMKSRYGQDAYAQHESEFMEWINSNLRLWRKGRLAKEDRESFIIQGVNGEAFEQFLDREENS